MRAPASPCRNAKWFNWWRAPAMAALVDALRAQGVVPDERLQALAAFTEAVIQTRGRVSDEALQALREAGYTDGNALEVIVGVGLATICNFGNNLAQTPLNDQLRDYAWSGA
ncbi:hypothetical protein G6F22_016883 [Rhizopus arrhizus]|nr:hypothetical protein G6F22_016883 [Rhizopus arrhizus]